MSLGNAHRVLVVDDEPATVRLLMNVLAAEGLEVASASNGRDALDGIQKRPPDLILLDLNLPDVNGYEVCRSIKDNAATRWIPIIILTGQSAARSKLRCWEHGADDFLTKPFQCVEVITRCRSLLRVKNLIDELDSAEAVVFAFARAVEAKSPYTHGHSERVRNYALLLAAHVGISADVWQTLAKGALLHDIGKISVPDAILNKPGPLTPEEYEIVKQHTVQGAHIVEPLRSIRGVIPLVRWHHERMDGRGYPDQLPSAGLPIEVRILSVADVYDSLSSARPYRSAIPHEGCLAMLRSDAAGGGLDPQLVERFCKILADKELPTLDGYFPRQPAKQQENCLAGTAV